jgi:serine/threonine-protein kinase
VSAEGDDRRPRQDETVTRVGEPGTARRYSPPVRDWDRYEILEYLGGGGMGRVFKAFDPRLGRQVALKFIRGDDPGLIRRFTQEARAQAQVDHERVCKVYEVGEVEGHPYIAMQLIDGVPLRDAARDMTLEQKLLVMKEVAEGLHEAHRNGLIHRDIKPSNIMVELSEDGRWKPYVMDFGLAREQASPGMTVTGALLGTPNYMPPEQALGWVRDLDRRSDVYQLGATMYSVISGRRPFEGDTHTVVLRRVLEDPPDPLTRGDRSIPSDIDAIVMKCLRKSPGERYPSARALAEDLGRYLDGEPVEARRTTWLYRLRLKAAKHRMAMTVGAVSLVLLVALAIWAGLATWRSARRARLAQSFGQQVERIEALARYSHTIPLHDVRPDRARIRERMDAIQRQLASVGRIGLGPGHYALGRGHLSMESWDDAREHLEAAWDAGYREPEVALALGRVLGAQYHEALQETAQIESEELRQAHREKIETAFLEPAVRYLREGQSAETGSPELVAALLVFYEERYDDALESAGKAYERRPWIYEARSLEGDVHEALAIESQDRGEYEAALESYQRALEAHRAAAAVGRSDPAVYVSLCGLDRAIMRMELHSTARDVTPYFERGKSQCERALEAAPGDLDALLGLASLHNRMGAYLRVKHDDPRDHYERVIELATQALQDRADYRAHGSIATALKGIGVFEQDRGNDPREYLRRAAGAYEDSIALNPDDLAYNDLGTVHKSIAAYERNRGDDPRESLRKAIDAYRESLERNPSQVAASTNLGTAYYDLALWEMGHGEDPLPSLEAAIEALRSAEKVNPNQIAVLYGLGRAYSDQAWYVRGRGEDPRALLDKATDAFRRAIDVNPESAYVPHFYSGMGAALDSRAHYEWDTGEDPTDTTARTVDAYRRAVASNPKHVYSQNNLGIARAFEAECSLERGEDPTDSVRAAVEASRRALEIKPDHHDAWDNTAHAYLILGTWELGSGLDPTGSLREARAATDASREINPNSAYSHYILGQVQTLEGRRRTQRGEAPGGMFEKAEASLDEAIRLDPDYAPAWEAAAELHRWRAEWLRNRNEPSDEELDRGLEQVDKALSINPRSASAMGLRGTLLLFQAEQQVAPELRGALLEQAEESLGRALATNPNLSRTFHPPLELAKALRSRIRSMKPSRS